MYKHFKVQIDNKIAHVAFNRAEKSNALHMDAWLEMKAIFESLSEMPEARVVILKGEGKHFCAGIDLQLLMSLESYKNVSCSGRQSEKIRHMILALQESVTAIEKCSKPVIAAIHNGCIGGGVDIAAACDLRYCDTEAYFTIKEIDMGMVADLGTLQRLPKLIPPASVAEMAYTGRKVYGEEAKILGLVNHNYLTKDDLINGVQELANTIASKSPISIRGTKEILKHTREHSVEDGLSYMATWNAAHLLSDDLTEAFKSMMEKRNPTFKD